MTQLEQVQRFANAFDNAFQHYVTLCRSKSTDCTTCPLTWDSICDQIATLNASIQETLSNVEQTASSIED